MPALAMTMIEASVPTPAPAPLPRLRVDRSESRFRTFLAWTLVAVLAAVTLLATWTTATIAFSELSTGAVWSWVALQGGVVATLIRLRRRYLAGDFDPVDYEVLGFERSRLVPMLGLDPILFERALLRDRCKVWFGFLGFGGWGPVMLFATESNVDWSFTDNEVIVGMIQFLSPVLAAIFAAFYLWAFAGLVRDEGRLDAAHRWMAAQLEVGTAATES